MPHLPTNVRHRSLRFRIAAVSIAVLSLGAASVEASVLLSFEGTSDYDTRALGIGLQPPDTMGAVGKTQYVELINGSFSVYDKTNGALLAPRITDSAFWTRVGQSSTGGDPRILYDHYTDRWIATGFGSIGSKINIAVSDTSNALGSWKSTQIVGTVGTTLDYPTLAIDNKGVYIGTNNFAPGFVGTSLFSIPKTDLFSGVPSLANMSTFNTLFPGGLDNGFAIQAAVNWGGNPTNTTPVMADSRDANKQVFYKLTGVDGTGVVQTAASYIAGSDYAAAAGPGRQPNGTRVVAALGPRISASVMQNNGMLYSVTSIDDGTDHSGIRWSVNDANTGALISSGMISDGKYDYYMGSIAVNKFGKVLIGYNRSGFETADGNGDGLADGNISFMARSFADDGSGNLLQLADYLLKVSTVNDYHLGSAQGQPAVGRQRWGDYSSVTLDPENEDNFWAIGQFAREFNNAAGGHPGGSGFARWGTWIAEINVVPEPGSFVLMFAGLLALGTTSRRRRQLDAAE